MSDPSYNHSQPQPVYFEEEVHLRDYIKVLRRRWKSLFLTFLAIFVITAVYTLGMRPVYQADTLLNIAKGSGTSGVLGELAAITRTANPIETEIEILKSRSLGAEVVQRLGLDVSVSDSRDGIIRRILGKLGIVGNAPSPLPAPEIMEVPPNLLGEPLMLRFGKGGVAYGVFHGKDRILEGTQGRQGLLPGRGPCPGGRGR